MPSLDERREVAENLRNMTAYGCRYAEQFYDLLQETITDAWDFHSFDDTANRLADLIEPEERTCRWVEDEFGGHHGECGLLWEFFHGGIGDNGVVFCPKCGAKVVWQ